MKPQSLFVNSKTHFKSILFPEAMDVKEILAEYEAAGGAYYQYIQYITSKLSPGHSSDRAFYNCAHVLAILVCNIKKHDNALRSCSPDDPFDAEFSLSKNYHKMLAKNLETVSDYISGQPIFFRVYFNREMYKRLKSAYDEVRNYRSVIPQEADSSDPDAEIFAQLGSMLRTLFADMQKGDVYHLLHEGASDPIYKVFQAHMAIMENLTDIQAAEQLQMYLQIGCIPSYKLMIANVQSTSQALVSCLYCSH